jgi:predicted MFS family arabinose efflux permease
MAIGNRLDRLRGRPRGHARREQAAYERVAVSSSSAPRPSYRSVFAVSEFRALWFSYVLSAGGDRLALVAMMLLVYARSKSPLLAAITFASGFVPYLFGGLFLSGLADRLPRRTVMVACDGARALLVCAMLLPHMKLGVLIALLYMVTTIQPPFDAARSATIRDIMDVSQYPLAAAVLQSTTRVVIVAGAAVGGLIVALFGAWPALAADAATFVASGLLILLGIRTRPAAASGSLGQNPLQQLAGGIKLVFGDPKLRTLMCLGWLAAFYGVPEGLAAPYAAKLGGGAVAAGLLIAFSQLGAAVTSPIFTKKIGPLTRLKWMGPMAVLTCAVLAVAIVRPGLAPSMAIFALSNVFAMYQIAANTAFVERLPNERRAQAFGLANAGLVVGQGVAFAVAGAAAEVVPPSTVVALSGGLGALIACGLALQWRRMSPAVGRHTARHLGREASLTRQTLVRAARSN